MARPKIWFNKDTSVQGSCTCKLLIVNLLHKVQSQYKRTPCKQNYQGTSQYLDDQATNLAKINYSDTINAQMQKSKTGPANRRYWSWPSPINRLLFEHQMFHPPSILQQRSLLILSFKVIITKQAISMMPFNPLSCAMHPKAVPYFIILLLLRYCLMPDDFTYCHIEAKKMFYVL